MDGRPEGPLRRLARPNLDEATEPVDVTFRSTLAGPERPQVKGARLVAGRARDVDQSMIQGERHVLRAQLRELAVAVRIERPELHPPARLRMPKRAASRTISFVPPSSFRPMTPFASRSRMFCSNPSSSLRVQ